MVCPEEGPADGPFVKTTASVPANEADSALTVLPERVGGKYLWVPDSLAGDVGRLLEGGIGMKAADKGIDFSERVTFRGDTLKMMLRAPNLGRFDRGLFNYLFIPRGIWQIGVTAFGSHVFYTPLFFLFHTQQYVSWVASRLQFRACEYRLFQCRY